jgi:hypothetical protein
MTFYRHGNLIWHLRDDVFFLVRFVVSYMS